MFYFIAKRVNDFSDFFVLVLLICLEGKAKQASWCRNFFVPVRDDTIYVTIDKTGRKVLP